jgi:hypothetical protein
VKTDRFYRIKQASGLVEMDFSARKGK